MDVKCFYIISRWKLPGGVYTDATRENWESVEIQAGSSQVENADKVNSAREKLPDNLITKTKLPSEYFTSLHYNDNAVSAAAGAADFLFVSV